MDPGSTLESQCFRWWWRAGLMGSYGAKDLWQDLKRLDICRVAIDSVECSSIYRALSVAASLFHTATQVGESNGFAGCNRSRQTGSYCDYIQCSHKLLCWQRPVARSTLDSQRHGEDGIGVQCDHLHQRCERLPLANWKWAQGIERKV